MTDAQHEKLIDPIPGGDAAGSADCFEMGVPELQLDSIEVKGRCDS